MKKKVLVILFIAILSVFFAVPCFAQSGPGLMLDNFNLIEHEGEYIVVADTEVIPRYPFYEFSNEKKGDSWAIYESGQLTLHNFRTFAQIHDTTGGHPHINFVLNLEGDNETGSIVFDKSEKSCIDKLTITGSGSLSIINPPEPDCIFSNGPIVIDENFTGTLNLTGSVGIRNVYAYEIAINNGNINIKAGSEGIRTDDGFLKINGGNVNIRGGAAGVHVECGTFSINGGNTSIESPNGMAVYHNDFSGGGKMPSIKRGYLGMELTEGINKLNIRNAEDVHSFKLNYTEPLDPVEPTGGETDPTGEPTTDPTVHGDEPTEPTVEPTNNLTLYIAIGCAVLILIIIIVIIRKKKH